MMINLFTRIGFVFALLLGLQPSLLMAQTPIWSEEFNGDKIDRNIWTYDVSGSGMGNQELEFNTDRTANSYLENGNLVIKAIKEEYNGNHFTSARLKTLGRFSFKYGILEARIKLPDLKNGLWPAFWTMGTNIGQLGWPKCGEMDILEAGSEEARNANAVNQQMTSAVHWWHDSGTWSTWLQADAGGKTTLSSGNFYDDYHNFKLVWDSLHVEFWLDQSKVFNMDIKDPNLSEFRKPQFIILNLAVGGKNYLNLTNPSQITAPLPAKMLVDYVRLYPIEGQTQVFMAKDEQARGDYGIYSEKKSLQDSLKFSKEAHLYFWNNVSATTTDAYEGKSAINASINAGNWWGMGILNDNNINFKRYSDGYLHLMMKTSSKEKIGIGISSANGESWVNLVDGGTQYGLLRDGNWHELRIPLNLFAIDFSTIIQPFMIKGDAPAAKMLVSVDDIYWQESLPRPTPSNGNFGVYTENTDCVAKFSTAGDGNFYIWENTLQSQTSTASEGSSVLSFTSAAGLSWFGAAFTPNTKYDLSAFRFPESKLHFDLKTNATTTFKIGIKSGNTPDLNQTWITFANGSDPYSFVRDGNWHGVDIPMSDFSNVDLTEVSQLFELLGTSGAISNIAIDNIYYSGGKEPLVGESSETVTGVSLDANTTLTETVSIQLSPRFTPAHPSNARLSYVSSNNAVASVTDSGWLTGVAAGIATITATTAEGGFTACTTVEVLPRKAVSGISISAPKLNLALAETVQLTAQVIPEDSFNKAISYTSSNTAVASVSAAGLVTAIAAGTATITATSADGGIKANAVITVSTATGIEDLAAAPSIRLYPNPTKADVAYLELNGFGQDQLFVDLFNAHGSVVLQQQFKLASPSGSIAINISQLSSGLYFLSLRSGTKVWKTKLMVNKQD